MIRRLFAALVLVHTVLLGTGHAAPEKRVALVIGNDTYQEVAKLEKAANDARAVGQQLKKVGFEVLSYTNLTRREMNQAIGQFVEKVSGGGVGVFFYAGHGVQAGGSNFLLPVDIKVKSEQDLVDEAVDMQRVLERLSDAKAKLSLLVIDACRDNPFKKAYGRSIGATRGLAIPQAPNGTLVVYSAGIGQQALDKLSDNDNNPNGLFTREFLPIIGTPGMRLDEGVRKLRSSVIAKAKSVGHDQNPAIYDQTDGDFYFINGPVTVNVQTTPSNPVVTPVGPSSAAVEMEFWSSIKASNDKADFQEYLRQYPNGSFAGIARNRIKALETVAVAPKVSAAVSSKEGLVRGDAVDVEWHGSWYPGSVLEVKSQGRYRIHYDGYDSSWDEVVGPDRIRARR
ncbi:MAG TPA: caspase family protein [Rhodocyclaceae bacterium]|nr:caspase family protein [Rhodocyclaceae bacterium]